ncbi:hypothetical protein E2976_17455 [Paracoccus yeei]|uniref:hypothetical protein n=1 Tax=Paracoccus yeei TaxID=147645 RepID=UPI003BF8BE9A
MPDPTDPRAVADDPSGIVQQMTEVGPRGPVPDDVLHHGAWQMADDLEGWFPSHNMARYADMMRDLAFDLRNARATEADLRAEVERLRVSLMAARKGLQGVKEMVMRGRLRNTIMQACKTEQGKLDIALSHENDGGQDA